MFAKCFEKVKTVYFIGIGGISMSSLAKFLVMQNYQVSGSDAVKNEQIHELNALGIKTYVGVDDSRTELKNADIVVYTDAINEDCSELVFARNVGKTVLSRADLLRRICENFNYTVAIAGSHGKTTCTAMCAHILKSARIPFTSHIGGHDCVLGNFYSSGKEIFLTEACEYKRNLFLSKISYLKI
jgi:UDP-N-acetylmuramate--alanine ligase